MEPIRRALVQPQTQSFPLLGKTLTQKARVVGRAQEFILILRVGSVDLELWPIRREDLPYEAWSQCGSRCRQHPSIHSQAWNVGPRAREARVQPLAGCQQLSSV